MKEFSQGPKLLWKIQVFFRCQETVLAKGLRVHLWNKTLWVQVPAEVLSGPVALGSFLISWCLSLQSYQKNKGGANSLIC